MSGFFLPSDDAQKPAETNQSSMTDIETMGTGPGAPILTIGAVLFDPLVTDDVSKLEERAFLRRIDISDAVAHSSGVDGGTLRWWLGQEDAAIKELISGDTVSLKTALADFSRYLVERGSYVDKEFFSGLSELPPASTFWAKSPDFDMKILEHAYAAVGLQPPFRFYQYRCVRTLQDICWPNGDDRPVFRAGVLHDARADAVSQAMMVQAGYHRLGLSHDLAVFDKLPV